MEGHSGSLSTAVFSNLRLSMRILHYSIGLPPVRHGGMVQYVLDLMAEQARGGEHQVALLYPGMRSLLPWSSIRKRESIDNVEVYEIINASDVPVAGGVFDPQRIIRPCPRLSMRALHRFIASFRPDILHVHSLMGIPQGLLAAARRRGARVVYTTHDYFGLCPTLHMVRPDGSLCKGAEETACANCCVHAPQALELFLRTRPGIYQARSWLNKLRAFVPHAGNPSFSAPHSGYGELRDYYRQLFVQIDYFHFNSSVSAFVFKQSFPILAGSIVGVTNAQIVDKRSARKVSADCVRIGFMGGTLPEKGLALMVAAGRGLLEKGVKNWKMCFWGLAANPGLPEKYCEVREDFSRADVHQVYASLDLLVVPSLWPETFGLVVLEAFSVGVPVLVSHNVGAKDLVASIDQAFVFRPDEASLEECLSQLLSEPSKLEVFSRKLLDRPFDFGIADHGRKIEGIYRDALRVA